MEQPTETQELPPELAERLHRLAATQMAQSRPWPGVDDAVRRSQRRRLGGISTVIAVGVLIGGVASGNLAPPTSSSSASSATALQRKGLAELRAAGYAGPTGGSLAGDRDWLSQLRTRVRDLAKKLPASPGGRANLSSATDVLVPWAGEVDGIRYAVAVYPSDAGGSAEPSFTLAVLAGPGGAAADRLTIRQTSTWTEAYPGGITSAQLTFVPGSDPAGSTLVFVTGPTVTGVKVASERHFSATGKISTQWRSLSRDSGMVWVGQLTDAEQYLSDVQISGADGRVTSGEPASAVIARMRAIAAAGTDQSALDRASEDTNQYGGSIVDQPVIAASTQLSSEDILAVAVLRSPDGPYVVSFSQTYDAGASGPRGGTGAGAVIPSSSDPDSFMAAVETLNSSTPDGPGAYLIVAPAGATTVSIGAKTATVKNRLAQINRDAQLTGEVTVKAMDSTGTVIATVRSTPAQVALP